MRSLKSFFQKLFLLPEVLPACIGNMWTTCGPIGGTNAGALTGAGGQLLFQTCNNDNGVHLSVVDGQLCSWTWTSYNSPGNMLEVFIDAVRRLPGVSPA